MTERTLKPGWKMVRFGDVVKMNTDRVANPLASGIERYVGLEHITPEDLHIHTWGLVAQGTTFTNLFKPGQVLFGKRRAYQRKVAVADFEGVCSGDIYVFETKDPTVLLPDLLPFLCQTEGFYQHAVGTSAGSLSPRTNWTQLAGYEFLLPLLDEQRRITRLLKATEETIESQEHLLMKTNGLRIPLINEFMGVVTNDEVVEIITGISKTTKRKWKIYCIQDISAIERQGVQVGPFGGSVSSKYFSKSGVPVLKINNITETGELDLSDLVFLDEGYGKSLTDKYSVTPGDIVTAAQATIGRTAIVTQKVAGAIISQHLIRIAVNPQICQSEWLHACFQTPLVIRQLNSVTQGGTRAGLNTNDVRKILVPIPPLNIQKDFCKDFSEANESSNSLSKYLDKSRELKKQFLMMF